MIEFNTFEKKYAHKILAAIGGFVSGFFAIILYDYFYHIFTSAEGVVRLFAVTLMFFGLVFTLMIGFWYEWHQVIDPDMANKYGTGESTEQSLDAFRKDSLQDVKDNLFGLSVGLFFGLLIAILLIKLL